LNLSESALELIRKYAKGRVLLLGDPEVEVRESWFGSLEAYKNPPTEKPSAKSVIEAFGCKVRYRGTADLVIETGLENNQNAYHGLIEAAFSVKKGGVIFHIAPISMVNYGYWNFCPKLFYEFYKSWEILEAWAVLKDHKVPLPKDRTGVASEVSMYFAARK
jgi:hypothetical protein